MNLCGTKKLVGPEVKTIDRLVMLVLLVGDKSRQSSSAAQISANPNEAILNYKK